MKEDFVRTGTMYIVSNFRRTVFYTGVTSNLHTRIYQHKNGEGSVFTRKYNLHYLMYYEELSSIEQAIQREKQIKRWHRDWKINLIKSINPEMKDLSEGWY